MRNVAIVWSALISLSTTALASTSASRTVGVEDPNGSWVGECNFNNVIYKNVKAEVLISGLSFSILIEPWAFPLIFQGVKESATSYLDENNWTKGDRVNTWKNFRSNFESVGAWISEYVVAGGAKAQMSGSQKFLMDLDGGKLSIDISRLYYYAGATSPQPSKIKCSYERAI